MSPHALERLATPRGDLQLRRMGEHLEMILNGVFIMASYNGASEALMVREAVRVLGREPEGVAVAGLGMGFTLRETLSHTGVRRVDVFEVEPKVIEWNRTLFRELNGGCLDDPRVNVAAADFVEALDGLSGYDAVCVDLDNGPEWTVLPGNDRLYTMRGFARLRACLNVPGAVSLWCPRRHGPTERLMKAVFDEVHCASYDGFIYTGAVRRTTPEVKA